MHEFSFKQKPTVKICGREYEFDPTNNDLLQGVVENYPKILHIAADLQQLLRDLKTGKADYPSVFEKNQDLLLTCKAFIIGCLGERNTTKSSPSEGRTTLSMLNCVPSCIAQ